MPEGNRIAAFVEVAYEQNGNIHKAKFRVAGNRVQSTPSRSIRLAENNYPRGSPTWVYVSNSGKTPYLHDEISKSTIGLAMCLMLLAPFLAVLLSVILVIVAALSYMPVIVFSLFFRKVIPGALLMPPKPFVYLLVGFSRFTPRFCLSVMKQVLRTAVFLLIVILISLLFAMIGIFFEDSMPVHWTNRPETWSLVLIAALAVSWYFGRGLNESDSDVSCDETHDRSVEAEELHSEKA